jgi:uncharacterized repeat protein (TIGR03806 family)
MAVVATLLVACGKQSKSPNAQVILAAEPAEKLSDYHLFLNANGTAPAHGVTPYDLVNPLFSDNAAKHRYVFIPKGEQASYSPDQVFGFPVGTVLVKTFAFAPDMRDPALGERFIETRLLIHKADGWVAYPYIWNAEGTEATYAPVGGRQQIKTIGPDGEALTINYGIPNRNQCKECHRTGDALMPIGPKARNLNHVGPSGLNQIDDWTTRGILANAPKVDDLPTVPAVFETSLPIGDRARAYLDINCAHCHKATGSASNSGLFLDWTETDPVGWGVHKRPTAAGRASGLNFFVIEPGQPDQSILLNRMESTEAGVMMPELSRTLVDKRGVALIREWITGLAPAK